MRLLPKKRLFRSALAFAAVAVVAGWVAVYRPWETHFRGRPTSYWSARFAVRPLGRPDPAPATPEWLDRLLVGLGVDWRPGLSTDDLTGPYAVPVLVDLLHDPNPHVCAWAAGTLAFMEPPPRQAVPALLEAWLRYKDDVRGPRERLDLKLGTPRLAACCVWQALWEIDPEAARRTGLPEGHPDCGSCDEEAP